MATSSRRARPDRARRSRSRFRSSSASTRPARRPAALVLVPTRELCVQVTEVFELIAGDELEVASVYGGVPLGAQATPGEERARHRRDTGPPAGPRRPASSCRSTTFACSCSTRPTACSTWASSRRSTGSSVSCRRTVRRCSSRQRSTVRSASSRAATRTSRPASRVSCPRSYEPATSTTASSPSPRTRRSRRSSTC